MKLVYNNVGKAGSSTMGALLHLLSIANHFFYEKNSAVRVGFYPEKHIFADVIRQLPDNSVVSLHANYIENLTDAGDVVWMNIVREPYSLAISHHYYGFDASIRKDAAVSLYHKELLKGNCSCARLEYDACVKLSYQEECREVNAEFLKLKPQMTFFCEKNSTCTLGEAVRNMEQYKFVGLNEEYLLSVMNFEMLFPNFFHNATKIYQSMPPARVTHDNNPLTGTTMKGSITDAAKQILKKYSERNRMELEFYEIAMRKFWKKSVQNGLVRRLLRSQQR